MVGSSFKLLDIVMVFLNLVFDFMHAIGTASDFLEFLPKLFELTLVVLDSRLHG